MVLTNVLVANVLIAMSAGRMRKEAHLNMVIVANLKLLPKSLLVVANLSVANLRLLPKIVVIAANLRLLPKSVVIAANLNAHLIVVIVANLKLLQKSVVVANATATVTHANAAGVKIN